MLVILYYYKGGVKISFSFQQNRFLPNHRLDGIFLITMITPRVTDSPFSSTSTEGWTPGPLSPPGVEGEVGCPLRIPQWMKDEFLIGGSMCRPDAAVRQINFFDDPEPPAITSVNEIMNVIRGPVRNILPPPLPELLPISETATTVKDVEDEEESERVEIEKCVFPRKNMVLALIAIHLRDASKMEALVPHNLWDIDNVRCAFQVAVLLGDVSLVAKLLTSTAFGGFHRLELSLTNPYLCSLLDIPSPVFTHRRDTSQPTNFTQLALKCLHRALELGEKNELIRDRTEVLKLITQSMYSCFNVETDEVAMLEVQQHVNYRKRPYVSEFLDSWKPTLICSPCGYSECSKDLESNSENIHTLDAQLYRQVSISKWDCDSHSSFSVVFRRTVSLIYYCEEKLQWGGFSPLIAAFTPWRIITQSQDLKYPRRLCLRELLDSGETKLDVSSKSMKSFSSIVRFSGDKSNPVFCPGSSFIARITDPLRGVLTTSGVLTGIKNGTLYYRSKAMSYSSPLMSRNTSAEFLHIEHPVSWPPSSCCTSCVWFCGSCSTAVSSIQCSGCGYTAEMSFSRDARNRVRNVTLVSEPPPLVDLE